MSDKPEDIKQKLQNSTYGVQERLEGSGKIKLGGLCRTCARVRYRATQYGNESAYCRAFESVLNPQDPVMVCSEYWPKGHPTLDSMIEGSTLITIKHYDNEGLYL